MVYLNPIFKESALDEYYRKLETGQAIVVHGESDFYTEIYKKGLRSISKFVPRGKILDIGCSSGFFLDIAKRAGWKTYGIEVQEVEVKLCRGKGHILYTKKLEELNLREKFDVITLWDVFEHMPNGKEQLALFKTKLAPGGVIFMQIPNSDALAAKVMRERCNMFDGLEHVNLYNPRAIKLIAQKMGLRVRNMETVISEIAVLNNYLHYEDPYFGNMSYRDKLLNIVSPRLIHKNLLGYKMQVVLARKN